MSPTAPERMGPPAQAASPEASGGVAVTAPPGAGDPPLTPFIAIGLGQVVSMLGTGLSQFAVGVWLYQQTQSISQYALMTLCYMLPALLISPLAGALVDRWDRRWVMIVSDLVAALGTLVMAALFAAGALRPWHLYLVVAVSSLARAFQAPAFAAAMSSLVPSRMLGRANGLMQLGEASSHVLAPVSAGALISTFGLWAVLLADFGSFLVALVPLLLLRIPAPLPSAPEHRVEGSRWQELTLGLRYISGRGGLMGLLILFAFLNVTLALVEVLVPAFILKIADAATLGRVSSIAALGMVCGSLLMMVWGGPRRRVMGIFGFGAVMALALVVAGARPSLAWIIAGGFGFFFCVPLISSCNQALWQAKVAQDVQGRVFAARSVVSYATIPVAYGLAGPLADDLFEPLLAPGGAMAGGVGRLIGVGAGRGIALLFVLMGLLCLAGLLAAFLHPRVRRVELELPDPPRGTGVGRA
jgi:DHA3 family macrolide efflux protein-like MFS transporter